MNFSHLSGYGLLLHLSLPMKLAMSWLLDQVAKLGKEFAQMCGNKCRGLGALLQGVTAVAWPWGQA